MRDLILDEKTETRIAEVIAAARNRETVLNDWGLGARIHRGTGLVSLFDGDPGTGKTHAAEVIASELGLSLVHVSVAAVVSKYIGETEKNLHRIFDEARPDMSLLLFDEADSLFSKRTKEVERSTDRYSNMDINVMLQLIERYPGITILTTNLKKAIDPAFERRFAFKITFDRPEHAERVRIWRYFLGAEVTTAEPIDFDRVAEVSLSGGEIKNALLRASYEAARHAQRLTTKGLVIAAETEAAAAGRLVRTHA
jgi:SpoVK/Ycf46/Vps4 family AAA+-type ATPase